MMPGQSLATRPDDHLSRRRIGWRPLLLITLLIGLTTTWTAVPGASGQASAVLTVVIIALAAVTSLELALRGVEPADPALGWAGSGARRVTVVLHALPWAEAFLIAAVALEAVHPARPWHTAILAVALLACVFAIHLAERDERPGALAPQLPLLAAGIGLCALAAGAAALPGPPATGASLLIRLVAAAAAVLAAALIIPVWMTRGR